MYWFSLPKSDLFSRHRWYFWSYRHIRGLFRLKQRRRKRGRHRDAFHVFCVGRNLRLLRSRLLRFLWIPNRYGEFGLTDDCCRSRDRPQNGCKRTSLLSLLPSVPVLWKLEGKFPINLWEQCSLHWSCGGSIPVPSERQSVWRRREVCHIRHLPVLADLWLPPFPCVRSNKGLRRMFPVPVPSEGRGIYWRWESTWSIPDNVYTVLFHWIGGSWRVLRRIRHQRLRIIVRRWKKRPYLWLAERQ